MEVAITQCIASTSEYRTQHGVSEVPSKVIESLVTQHIAPLAGQANVLNVSIIKGKADWRRNATEVVFRKIFLNITVSLYFFF